MAWGHGFSLCFSRPKAADSQAGLSPGMAVALCTTTPPGVLWAECPGSSEPLGDRYLGLSFAFPSQIALTV